MVEIRSATLADADAIVHHRHAMFVEMGYGDTAAVDAMSNAFRPWLQRKMAAGHYLAWVAIAGQGIIVAGLGLWLMDWPPHMVGPGSDRANILNVYTEPTHRRQGIARRLVDTALGWCRDNGVRTVILHASADGRPLYDKLGFTATNEMRLLL